MAQIINNLAKTLLIVIAFAVITPTPASAQTTGSLHLVTPNGGESFKIGDTVPVKWTSTGSVDRVSLTILGYNSALPSSATDEEKLAQICLIENVTITDIPNNGQYSWLLEKQFLDDNQGKLCNYYKLQVLDKNFMDSHITDTSDSYFTISDSSTGDAAHPVGTNVIGSDGTVYFINVGNTRSPYTSAGAFLSYRFNSWANVVPANSADMALPLTTYNPEGNVTTYFIAPRNGALINDKGTVYIITSGLRRGFASAQVFTGLGYSSANAYPGDTSFMMSLPPIDSIAMKHPDGGLINDGGTLYVMNDGNRMGFPSLEVFNGWGYWPTEAVTANSYDQQAALGEVIKARAQGQLNVVTSQPTDAAIRDQRRLADIRQLAVAQEIYYNDFGRYPEFLNNLVPNYISQIPQAPLPADGTCSVSQDQYTYSQANDQTYSISFCFGSATGGYGAGVRTLSPSGIQ